MPTEIHPDAADISDVDRRALDVFQEFGATTGRPRRAGWFDAELTSFSVKVNGISQLFLTKLDVLSELEEIKVCTGYELGGKRVHYYDVDSYNLDRVKPIYKSLRGWKQDIRGIRKYKNLPAKARAYVETIENLTGIPIGWVSNGPEREAVIKKPADRSAVWS
jgi:adenylosuccinate synthase